MEKIIFCFLFLLVFVSCSDVNPNNTITDSKPVENFSEKNPYLVVLGVAQDAGFPQAACKKDCCKNVWSDKNARKMVSCLGLVNPTEKQSFLFDATPDFKDQLDILQKKHQSNLGGIFLTHAHIGHYTGLMNLGREAMGANETKVFAMPKMKSFLETNGPWSQLVNLKNIVIQELNDNSTISISNKKINITPLLVPHRDEFSETVGFLISGNLSAERYENKTALFIPDIDKWEKWTTDIIELISKVDYAFLDGSFYKNGEIPGRDMSLIPHPFMEESMNLFQTLSAEDKAKIHFIHFNHTNPVLHNNSDAYQEVLDKGFRIAKENSIFEL